MPYRFDEWDPELEPQAASSRGGLPPRKTIVAGVLDPPEPPKKPPGPTPFVPTSWVGRFLAAGVLLLLGLLLGLLVRGLF